MAEAVRIYAVTGSEVVRVTLAGGRAIDPESVLQGIEPRCTAVDPNDPRRVYAGTFDDGLYASEDGGVTWRADERGLEDRRVLSVAVSGSHREAGISVAYAGTEPSNLYRSSDGGRSWQ